MKVEQMVRVFHANGVPDHYYVVDGLGAGEVYGIAFMDGKWTIYYSERGKRTPVDRYESEDEAVANLITRVDRDMRANMGRPIDVSKH